jgi:hypothetical protein
MIQVRCLALPMMKKERPVLPGVPPILQRILEACRQLSGPEKSTASLRSAHLEVTPLEERCTPASADSLGLIGEPPATVLVAAAAPPQVMIRNDVLAFPAMGNGETGKPLVRTDLFCGSASVLQPEDGSEVEQEESEADPNPKRPPQDAGSPVSTRLWLEAEESADERGSTYAVDVLPES